MTSDSSRHFSRSCVLFVLLVVVGCGETSTTTVSPAPARHEKQTLNERPLPPVSYDKRTLFQLLPPSETGIDFENIIVEDDQHNILTYSYMYNGGGVAAGDINNDGLTDLFFTSNQQSNRLFLNQGNFKFKDISESAGVTKSKGWHSGVNMVDINGDGFLDIYVCRSGPGNSKTERANLLLINNGNLGFTDQADAYGLADTNHSTQASFFDYDQDGDLDVYVMNHPVFFGFQTVRQVQELIKTPKIAAENTDNLYRNEGDGSFTRVTDNAGVRNLGYGLGLITADLNGDNLIDIYVADDFSTPDFMYINQGDGTFIDEIKSRTGHISYYGMGLDLMDVNCDLQPDLVELDMTAQDRVRSKTLMPSMDPRRFWALVKGLDQQYQYMFNSFQLNQGDGHFSEIGLMAGVAKTDWSWAVLGADFDNDGWDDLMVTNGFRRDSKDNDFLIRFRKAINESGGRSEMIRKGLMMKWVEQIPSQRIRNYLFKNLGNLKFDDQSIEWGFHRGSFSSGAAYADLDNDGDLDVIINNIDDPAFVYKNDANEIHPDRHFVQVKIDGPAITNTNATVIVKTAAKSQMKTLTSCRGYQSAVEPILHFGLGQSQSVDSIEVKWADGTQTRLENPEIDRRIVISKEKQTTQDALAPSRLLRRSAQSIPFWHQENDHNEYAKEILLPHSQSNLGPALAVADVDQDGLDDIFVGGAARQTASLLLQSKDGSFKKAAIQPWRKFNDCENVAAIFFDADNDADLDLYVVNGGGSEYPVDSPLLADQFYRNNGGTFDYESDALPDINISGGTVASLDYDGDGDLDLFVGGRNIPGKYPYSPKSYFLNNNDGKFEEDLENAPGDLGLINDSVATDFDQDGDVDLVVVGEWTGPIVLKNNGGVLQRSSLPGVEDLRGWWFCVEELDINQDGLNDYLLGNLGLNNKFKSKSDNQLTVHCSDFDNNGTLDIVLATEVDGKEYPVRGKECSTQQMPFLEEKFPTFHEFAMADLAEIVGDNKLNEALTLRVNEFRSCLLIQTESGFQTTYLPSAAQISPLRDALAMDLNGDGHLDLLTIGNLFNTEVETVRYDAGQGLVLLGDGKGNFRAKLSGESGFRTKKDGRRISLLQSTGKPTIVVANNNDQLEQFEIVGELNPEGKTTSSIDENDIEN